MKKIGPFSEYFDLVLIHIGLLLKNIRPIFFDSGLISGNTGMVSDETDYNTLLAHKHTRAHIRIMRAHVLAYSKRGGPHDPRDPYAGGRRGHGGRLFSDCPLHRANARHRNRVTMLQSLCFFYFG